MKKILSLAIAVLATAGLTLQAANVSNRSRQDNDDQTKKVMVDKKGEMKKKHFNAFEGLNLTDQQKEQLKALKPRKADKKQVEQGKAPQVKLTAEQRKQIATERLAKIKSILTPEQYQQYLENVAVHQMSKEHKKGHKGMKGEGRRPVGKVLHGGKAPHAPRGENATQEAQ